MPTSIRAIRRKKHSKIIIFKKDLVTIRVQLFRTRVTALPEQPKNLNLFTKTGTRCWDLWGTNDQTSAIASTAGIRAGLDSQVFRLLKCRLSSGVNSLHTTPMAADAWTLSAWHIHAKIWRGKETQLTSRVEKTHSTKWWGTQMFTTSRFRLNVRVFL